VPTGDLPREPSIEHLRNQARKLQRAVRAGDADALALVAEFHPRGGPAAFSLTDAQLVTARRYGFASWPRLREYVGTVLRYSRRPQHAQAGDDLADTFLRLACLTYGGDDPARRTEARRLLAAHPHLATANIHTAAAVGEVAAATALLDGDPALAAGEGGPHRWPPLLYLTYSRLDSSEPAHSPVAVARLLLARGADPDAGYLWDGAYAFTALTGVFGGGEEGPVNQPRHRYCDELARLLLDAGADANDSQALYNRQFTPADDHLRILLAYGLGTGSGGPWRARLGPAQQSPARMVHGQLIWAAQHDLPDRVRLLVEHGADIEGAHEAAVLAGNTAIAELLLDAGAEPVPMTPVQRFTAACMAADRAGVDRLAADDAGLAARAVAAQPDLVVHAAGIGRLDAVRLMAAVGFDVNALAGRTALHEAAWNGDLPMVELLLELGADPTLVDCEHHATPAGFAEYNHQQHVVDRLSG